MDFEWPIPCEKRLNEINLNNIIKCFKYCMVGGTGAIVDFTLYSLLIYIFNLNYLISNIFSFSFAILVGYYLQKNWTFQYRAEKISKTFNRYVQVVVITYILNNIILIISAELLDMGWFISKIIQILTSFVWGYYAINSYVFNKDSII